MTLPHAETLAYVSPSRLGDLVECRLRVAFKQHAKFSGAKSDAQIIGDSLHAALKMFNREGEFAADDAVARIETRFFQELETRAPGREVAGTRVAAARLKKIAGRIIELTSQAGPDAAVLGEEELEARHGRIRGVVDLIIDGSGLHALVDYKTGPATDDDGEVAAHIQAQVQLYAVLEQERSGRWPERGVLLRFGGAPLIVELDPTACAAVADQAVETLQAYNALAGTVPPASPSESTCHFCSFAPGCTSFWEAVSPAWSRGAVRGRVCWAECSAVGGVTVELEGASGSYEGTVVIRRLSKEQLPGSSLPIGAELVVCGVYADRDGRLLPDKLARIAVITDPG